MSDFTREVLMTTAGMAAALTVLHRLLRMLYELPSLFERLVVLVLAFIIAFSVHWDVLRQRDAVGVIIVILNACVAYLSAFGVENEMNALRAWRRKRA